MPFAPTVAAPATDLIRLPAREIAALVRVGRLTAQDVLTAHLSRLPASGSRVDTRRATGQAVRLDTRLRHGVPGGALAGVPVLAAPGLHASGLLQAAGAILLGDADPDVAATAVASAVVPLALVPGSPHVLDAALRHGVVGTATTLAGEAVALLTRDARDAGAALAVLADRPVTPAAVRAAVRGLRVGVVVGPAGLDPARPEVGEWISALAACGVAVTRVEVADPDPVAGLPEGVDVAVLPGASYDSGVGVPGAVTLVLPEGVALIGRQGAEADLLAAASMVRRA